MDDSQELERQKAKARSLLGVDSSMWPRRLMATFSRTPSEADTFTALLDDLDDTELAFILVQALSTLDTLPSLARTRLLAYATHNTLAPTQSQIEALALAIRHDTSSPLAALVLSRFTSTIDPHAIEGLIDTILAAPVKPGPAYSDILLLLLKMLPALGSLGIEPTLSLLWPRVTQYASTALPRAVQDTSLWSCPPLRALLLALAMSDHCIAMSALVYLTPPELYDLATSWKNTPGLNAQYVIQSLVSFTAATPLARAHKPLVASLLSNTEPSIRTLAFALLAPRPL